MRPAQGGGEAGAVPRGRKLRPVQEAGAVPRERKLRSAQQGGEAGALREREKNECDQPREVGKSGRSWAYREKKMRPAQGDEQSRSCT